MKCYLCGSANLNVLRDHLRHNVQRNVLRCADCGLNYLEPKADDLRTFYAGQYRQTYSPATTSAYDASQIYDMYAPMQAERIKRLRPHFGDSWGRLLAVGASAGHFLAAARNLADEVVGIEFNLENVAFMRQRLQLRAYETPLEETDLPINYFDRAVVFHTLEHMEDPRAFLQSLRRYLKPEAVVYIEVPSVDDALLSVFQVAEYANFWYREPHLFNFSPATLPVLLSQAGFTGKLLPVQRYGLTNHLHWLFARQPQSNAEQAMGTLLNIPQAAHPAAAAVGQWLENADEQYRQLLCQHGVSESIGFVARLAAA